MNFNPGQYGIWIILQVLVLIILWFVLGKTQSDRGKYMIVFTMGIFCNIIFIWVVISVLKQIMMDIVAWGDHNLADVMAGGNEVFFSYLFFQGIIGISPFLLLFRVYKMKNLR